MSSLFCDSFATWKLLMAIYKAGWNKLLANKNQRSFRQCISAQFNKTSTKSWIIATCQKESRLISQNFSFLSLSDPAWISWQNQNFSKINLYWRNLSQTIYFIPKYSRLIVNINDIFSKLSANKVSEIYKVIKMLNQKSKLRFNITTKGFSRKQIIVSMR